MIREVGDVGPALSKRSLAARIDATVSASTNRCGAITMLPRTAGEPLAACSSAIEPPSLCPALIRL